MISFTEFHEIAVPQGNLAERMSRYIEMSNHLIGGLFDPEYGAIGAEFLDEFQKTGCREYAPLENAPIFGTYTSFEDELRHSFINEIRYWIGDLRLVTGFLFSRLHEGNHALAWAKAAILHASPYNNMSVCVPCPEDFALIAQRIEEDTYAKQGWICSLIEPTYPEVNRFVFSDPISHATFNTIRSEIGPLNATLVAAAHASLQTPHVSSTIENPVTLSDDYHAQALNIYRKKIAQLRRCGLRPVFMRMEDRDIHDLGNTFGPNILASDPSFLAPAVLSPRNQFCVDRMRRFYGIPAREDLPSFSEVLADNGLDRATFLRMSKGEIFAAPQNFKRVSNFIPRGKVAHAPAYVV